MLKELPSAVCEEAFPSDPDFPQLRIASDPALMLEVFRNHLRPVAGKSCEILDCIPYRFRCRQSTTRCVLQYTLRVAGQRTNRQSDQWVTGIVYADEGEAERLSHELNSVVLRREIPARWLKFEPVAFIPELQMLVQVFPFDRRLPNLCPVLNGALRAIEPLMLARLGPGGWRVEDRNIEPTRYRTELGAALKYTLGAHDRPTDQAETLCCYVKVYRNDQGEETFRLLRSLSATTDVQTRPYCAIRPLSYLRELRALALEEAPGSGLQHVLRLGGVPMVAAAHVVARAVAAFNQDPIAIKRTHSLADQFIDVKRASSLVQWACPELRTEARAITAAVLAGLREVPPAPIHRDLKPDHIFCSGERVTFIDLDSVALGDPVRDPAHLFAHLTARVGLDSMPQEIARTAAAEFIGEYFDHVPQSWRKRLPPHCAGALIEVAAGIFKRQEPQWPEKVAACIEEAQRALSGEFK